MQKKVSIIIIVLLSVWISMIGFQKVKAVVPLLKEGSFLSGQTLSVWPSWSALSGITLPVDPINKLAPAGTCASTTNIFCIKDANCPPMPGTTTPESCILHDPATGWSTVNRRFSFACSNSSYAYRYILSSSTKDTYIVRAHFEDPFGSGSAISNWGQFVGNFISTTVSNNQSYFVIDSAQGICNQDQEITSIQQGVCGDGVINLNQKEQCDPPGRTRYGSCGDSQTNKVKVDVCNRLCQWVPSTTPFINCSSLSKCGNGIVEAGEKCDDGRLNGTYNHCKKDCTKLVANEPNSPGFCGDGALQSKNEVCDPTGPKLPDGSFWSLKRENSCNWNCQGYGPYCGDGIINGLNGSEECDGNKDCDLNGQKGKIVCDNNCKIVFPSLSGTSVASLNSGISAWWTFDATDVSGNNVKDKSGNGNDGILNGGVTSAVGKIDQALAFNGTDGYINIASPIDLQSGTAPRTMSAWIKGFSNPPILRSIIGYGQDSMGRLFYLSIGAYNNKLFFWGSSQNVQGTIAIDPNVWTHVAVTYDGTTVKLFVNGSFDAEDAPDLDTETGTALNIGGNAPPYSAFDGQMDDVIIYDRALSDSEIQALYNNKINRVGSCTLSQQPVQATSIPGSCGDSKVGANEACDKGITNGKPCTPSYGKACTYCSADCQNVIDVQPTSYCGNGIIEGNEICDTDINGTIYSSVTNTTSTVPNLSIQHNGYPVKSCFDEAQEGINTLKKGTKVCSACKAITLTTGEDKCIKCGGPDKNGIEVTGNIINVLDPRAANPLLGDQNQSGDLALYLGAAEQTKSSVPPACASTVSTGGSIGSTGIIHTGPFLSIPVTDISLVAAKSHIYVAGYSCKATSFSDFSFSRELHSGDCISSKMPINSNSICSNGSSTSSYFVEVNGDSYHPHPVSVIADPYNKQPWKYDLLLSPEILASTGVNCTNQSAVRPNDIRIVLSWVGNGEFYAGFLDPSRSTDPLGSTIEGFRYIAIDPPDYFATGKDYYTHTDINYKKSGIWYHGFGATSDNTTNVEAFTVDASAMDSGNYVFYVRSGGPIKPFQSAANLKVEVYLPEVEQSDSSKWYRHFALPSMTYYLSGALPSDNAAASYWQVFNLLPTSTGATQDNILDVNSIVTAPANFIYSASCVGRVGICRAEAGPCDVAESCVADDCPADKFVDAGTVGICDQGGSVGTCENKAYCDGLSSQCQPRKPKPPTEACSGYTFTSFCDPIQYCTGSSPDCPTGPVQSMLGSACVNFAGNGGTCDGVGSCLSCGTGKKACKGSCISIFSRCNF